MNSRRVLDPGRRLDAAAHVHTEGTNRGDRVRDVGRIESAGEHQLRGARELRGAAPIGSAARRRSPALRRECGCASAVGRASARLQPVPPASPPTPSAPAASQDPRIRLQHIRPKPRPHLVELTLRRMQHHCDSRNPARHALCELRRLRGSDLALRRREHESDGIGSRCDRRLDRFAAWSGRRSSPRSPRRYSSSIAAPVAIRILRVRTAIARSRPAASISPSSLPGSAEFISVVPTSARS